MELFDTQAFAQIKGQIAMQDLTEAQAERICDRAVMRRLSTDRAYRNAADAESQAEREQQITDEEWSRLEGRIQS